MRAKWVGVAVAAVMGCGAQQAEAATVHSLGFIGQGQASIDYTSNDPNYVPFHASGLGNIEGQASDFVLGTYADALISIGNIGIGADGYPGVGYASYTTEINPGSTYFQASFTDENVGGLINPYFTGSYSLDLKTDIGVRDGNNIEYRILGGKGTASIYQQYSQYGFDEFGNGVIYDYYGNGFITFDISSGGIYATSAVPLPASAPLFGAALLALGGIGYASRRSKPKAA